ncbi:MAG: transglutaminase-like domain-containing protein [Clostridia bacterium]|nr:transglutaminase-like domain-containing protein [Clostridia bacterium]
MKKNRRKTSLCFFLFAFALCLNAGCAQGKAVEAAPEKSAPEASAAIAYDPAAIRMPEAAGRVVMEKNGAYMDASNAAEGYVMVRCDAGGKLHKVGVSTDDAAYYYTLPKDGGFIVCPLQMGDGSYTVQVYEQVAGTQYSPLSKWALDVKLSDGTLPYLYPNQFVDYRATDETVRVSFTQCAGVASDRAKAEKLYSFVAGEIAYDYDKAKTVQDGYLPAPDRTLQEKKGICFDYAALLAAMLRVQNIPARLQMGELSPDGIYHAWNLVCIDDLWYLMDATLDGQGYKDENYTAVKNY